MDVPLRRCINRDRLDAGALPTIQAGGGLIESVQIARFRRPVGSDADGARRLWKQWHQFTVVPASQVILAADQGLTLVPLMNGYVGPSVIH